jgi:hypothetical protein
VIRTLSTSENCWSSHPLIVFTFVITITWTLS